MDCGGRKTPPDPISGALPGRKNPKSGMERPGARFQKTGFRPPLHEWTDSLRSAWPPAFDSVCTSPPGGAKRRPAAPRGDVRKAPLGLNVHARDG